MACGTYCGAPTRQKTADSLDRYGVAQQRRVALAGHCDGRQRAG